MSGKKSQISVETITENSAFDIGFSRAGINVWSRDSARSQSLNSGYSFRSLAAAYLHGQPNVLLFPAAIDPIRKGEAFEKRFANFFMIRSYKEQDNVQTHHTNQNDN